MRLPLRIGSLSAVLLVALQGCSSEPVDTGEEAAALSDSRARCEFKKGALPSQTQVGSIPAGTIDKVVVLMQENRSFDHLFHNLNQYAKRTDIDVATKISQPMNPDFSGRGNDKGPYVEGQHAPHLCFGDTNHEWSGAHLQYNDGKMNGFWATNQGESELGLAPQHTLGARALWWYDEKDIPFYYDVAATYGVGDRYFSSLMGPTFPNRDFLYGATSKGLTYNFDFEDHLKDIGDHPFQGKFDPKNPEMLFDLLEANGISWKVYSAGQKFNVDVPIIAGVSAAIGASGPLTRWGAKSVLHFKDIGDYYDDAKSGKLPQVSFIDANLTGGDPPSDDDHPPGNIQDGERFVSRIVKALTNGKDWSHTAMFVTWDENGGLYDHVEPPKACAPDDRTPRIGYGEEEDEYIKAHPEHKFEQLGFRVPVLVISPWVKPRHVSHNVYDHTSILRFIETRFNLPALTNRDANADPMLDFFDFSKPAYAQPPKLAEAGNNKAEAKYCEDTFGPPTLVEKLKGVGEKVIDWINPFD